MTILRRPVPPLEPPRPAGGLLGHVIVTMGDRPSLTDATIREREDAEAELAMWHGRPGCGRYAIAEVRLPP